ncbi:MAG: ParB N-terminal domain-containing protein [Erythrobacter sp.]|jgi:ParB-like chromosome segregation protein Spo0J
MSGRRPSEPMRERLFVENVTVPAERLRGVNEDAVARLADSFLRLGQRLPISVRMDGDDVVLVAGLHRLRAAQSLGWDQIDAVHCDGDETDARLWEIAENLHRAELSTVERRQHIAEWVKLTAEKVSHGETPFAGGHQPTEQGIRKAAKELGISKDTAQRAVAAESLTDDVKAQADEMGLGTVKRAELASNPNPAAQLDAIRRERDKAEAAKRNRETDQAIAITDAQEFAAWLNRHCAPTELNQVIAWLQGTKAKDVIAALRRAAA